VNRADLQGRNAVLGVLGRERRRVDIMDHRRISSFARDLAESGEKYQIKESFREGDGERRWGG